MALALFFSALVPLMEFHPSEVVPEMEVGVAAADLLFDET